MAEQGKYIHYCWFGGKPLPKLARKCLESWKKYLPDYEIICWNEKNCNFDECDFVRKAYGAKYYAFVADYIRTKAMCEMGGIYFDTDMEVTKDPKPLMDDCESFLGVEDTGKVCCGVWYEKYSNSFLATQLLDKYRNMNDVDFEKRQDFSIPLLITEILEPCGFDYKKRRIQVLEHNITIFPRDYFYPYSYNRSNNLFTDNTCMIHYYDASWLPVKNRIENYLVRHCGRERAIKIIKAYQKTGTVARESARKVLFPVVMYRGYKKKMRLVDEDYINRLDNTLKTIRSKEKKPYLVLHNDSWFGVTSATKELFKNTVSCRELYRKKDIKEIAEAIKQTRTKQVIFSAMSEGWPKLVEMLHKIAPEIKLKVFWHGSMSQVLDSYGWKMHKEIMRLCRKGYIFAFATCKESLYNFYRAQGINVYFITNSVEMQKQRRNASKENKIKIGLYAASPSNWRKNMFSQMAAVSLIKDAVLDIVPLDEVASGFAKSIGVDVTGEPNNISREMLFERMSGNDVNLYVTFSECSPMLPLESLEAGVPCITGDNHHYFKDTALEEYLVVSQEDNPETIKEKILVCMKKRNEILKMYEEFRDKNNRDSQNDVRKFLDGGM